MGIDPPPLATPSDAALTASPSRSAGEKNNLIISMLAYEPHVRCAAPRAGHQAPNVTLCDEIGNGMDATTEGVIFGPAGEAGVDVGLPRRLLLLSPEGSCEVVVGTRGPLDTVAWFEVYVGMRAVSRMCVDQGLGGISTGQGGLLSRL